MLFDCPIILRGGGDLATGVAQKFYRSGFKVLIAEIEKPTAIRRTVSLCEAIFEGTQIVEDITGQTCNSNSEIEIAWKNNIVPVIVDPNLNSLSYFKPLAVIDAIIAKKNLGTNKNMAEITIALGPGFYASKDVDIVIETMRGHDLGRLITEGFAKENTGEPGIIEGKSKERVIHAEISGTINYIKNIGDLVLEGETVFKIDDFNVKAPFSGLLRGLIKENLFVKEGMKIADIDPRKDININTISDKARNLGGAALEAFFMLYKQK